MLLYYGVDIWTWADESFLATKAVKTTAKLTKTTPVVIPPTATPSVVVPPIGGVIPPVLVEIPSVRVTSTKASVTPTATQTPPGAGTPTELIVAPTTYTDGGVRADDPPQNGGDNGINNGGENGNNGGNNNGGNGGNNGGNSNPRVLLKENVQDASSKTGQEGAQVSGQANSLQ